MADQKQSRLQINFGNLKFLLTTPANTTLDNLKEKAAKKCGVSTSFVLQYFDDDFKEWFVVDEDYELPVKGKLQLVELQTPSTSSSGPLTVKNEPMTKPSTASSSPPTVTNEPKTEEGSSTPDSGAVPPSDKTDGSQSQGDDQTVDTDDNETKSYPMCGSAPVIPSMEGTSDTQAGAAAAHASKEKVWKGRQSLKVYFMDADGFDDLQWKCRGNPMNIETIFSWARVWNFVGFEEIPSFEFIEIASRADIRVKFSSKEGNWSMIGMRATEVTDLKKPTMHLNLQGHTPELQQSLVVHEFGHALGLEHEHQSSDFWDTVGKHLDINEMKKDPKVQTAFEQQWARMDTGEQSVNELSEYDPDSIMHYKFDIKWIANKALRAYDNIDKDTALSAKEKKYLKALHKKKGQLSKQPTLSDYKVLAKAYGRTLDENSLDGRKLQQHLQKSPDQVFVGPQGKVLRVNTHLRVIRNAVWPMRAYWRNLGGELRITPGTLEAIDVDRRDSGAKLGAVLEKWMYTGKATTDDLISALRSVSVLRDDLANEISSHKEKPDAAEYGF